VTETRRLYLGEYLFMDPARTGVKKPRFGDAYMLLGPFIFAGLHVFQMSAVLGYARRDRLEALMGLLPVLRQQDPNAPVSWVAHSESVVRHYLALMKGREPTSFWDYWSATHYPPVAYPGLMDPKIRSQLQSEKVLLPNALDEVTWYAGEGLVFGAKFGPLFERLYRDLFETPQEQWRWDRARAAGVDLPPQQDLIPLDVMVRDVLVEMSAYVSRYFPELLDELDLLPP
jgi:hypothetical protein